MMSRKNFIFFKLLSIFFTIQGSQYFKQCPDKRFFGPSCKYLDLRHRSSEIRAGKNIVTDGNQCKALVEGERNISIKIDTPTIIPWVRVYVQHESSASKVFMSFTLSNGSIQPCLGEEKAVSKHIVDIMCHDTEAVAQFVNVKADIYSTCDVFISLGRNNAPEGIAALSTTDLPWKAKYCNDEILTSMCQTALHDDYPWWTLTFNKPVHLYAYRIENRLLYKDRAKGHTVVLYDKDNNTVWSHKDNGNAAPEYFQTVDKLSSPVWRFNFSTDYHPRTLEMTAYILNIMEFELYSDFLCPKGFFGEKCEGQCNCAHDEAPCFTITGGCKQGCAIGYEGPGCNITCQNKTYGINCTQACSRNCQDLCNPVNGSCHKCKDGFRGPRCDDVCAAGTYGHGCSQACGSCLDPPCSPETGACNGDVCQAGWQGGKCELMCSNFTWGVNCSNTCSEHCAGTGECEAVNGKCKDGCKIGFMYPACIHSFANATRTVVRNPPATTLSIFIFICLLAIPIICIVLYFLSKRMQSKSQRPPPQTVPQPEPQPEAQPEVQPQPEQQPEPHR